VTTNPQQAQQQTTLRLATVPSSQQFILTTTGNALPISQTTAATASAAGLVNEASLYDSAGNDYASVAQTRQTFVRPAALPTNVLRLTVVRK